MIIKVRVFRGRSSVEADGTNVRVYTSAPMENNRANADIVGQLSKHYGVTKDHVRIIRGHKSRNKTIAIMIEESTDRS